MHKKSKSQKKNKRNYTRIPKFLKNKLIKLVINDHVNITDASKLLNLKYSAAKATIDNIRKKNIKKQVLQSSKRCSYKKIVNPQCVQYSVCSSLFGKVFSTKYFEFDVLSCQK